MICVTEGTDLNTSWPIETFTMQQHNSVWQKFLDGGGSLIDKAKYDKIVSVLLSGKTTVTKLQNLLNYSRSYCIASNVEGNQLYRLHSDKTVGKKVALYEDVSDHIHNMRI